MSAGTVTIAGHVAARGSEAAANLRIVEAFTTPCDRENCKPCRDTADRVLARAICAPGYLHPAPKEGT